MSRRGTGLRRGRTLARLRRGSMAALRKAGGPANGLSIIDIRMLERAIRLSRKAAALGEVPVGAVVYCNGKVVAEAFNVRETTHDPVGHAELVAMQEAGRRLGRWRLTGCSLAVTLEPCAMCAGAMVNARLDRVIYGATDAKAGGCESLYAIASDLRLNHRLTIHKGIHAARCARVLSAFFRGRRLEQRQARSVLAVERHAHSLECARQLTITASGPTLPLVPHSTSAPPRLVCFDLGGVVVRICRTWEEGCAAAGLPLRRMAERDATRHQRHAAVVEFQTGRIDGAAFAARISAILDGAYSPEEILTVHRAWILGEYPGVRAVIDSLHARGVETGVLSNTNAEHWSDLRRFGAFGALRNRHASHLLGLHKPDQEIYRAFERHVGRSGSEILFFDDLPENIESAAAVGWRAVRIDPMVEDTADQMHEALQRVGLG